MIKVYESNENYVEKYKGNDIYFIDGEYTTTLKWYDPFTHTNDFIPITDRDLDGLKSKIDDRYFDWESQVYANYD